MTDNIIELPVSHDCNQTDGNIVSKEDDDILKKWVMIGHHFFKSPVCPSELRVTSEAGQIVIELENENFRLCQYNTKGIPVDEIILYNGIDRTDAYRIAGALISWASAKHLHYKDQNND